MRTIPTTLAVSGAIWARRVAAVQQVQPELLAGHQHSLQRRPLSATAVPSVLRAPQLGEILIRQAAEPQAERGTQEVRRSRSGDEVPPRKGKKK